MHRPAVQYLRVAFQDLPVFSVPGIGTFRREETVGELERIRLEANDDVASEAFERWLANYDGLPFGEAVKLAERLGIELLEDVEIGPVRVPGFGDLCYNEIDVLVFRSEAITEPTEDLAVAIAKAARTVARFPVAQAATAAAAEAPLPSANPWGGAVLLALGLLLMGLAGFWVATHRNSIQAEPVTYQEAVVGAEPQPEVQASESSTQRESSATPTPVPREKRAERGKRAVPAPEPEEVPAPNTAPAPTVAFRLEYHIVVVRGVDFKLAEEIQQRWLQRDLPATILRTRTPDKFDVSLENTPDLETAKRRARELNQAYGIRTKVLGLRIPLGNAE